MFIYSDSITINQINFVAYILINVLIIYAADIEITHNLHILMLLIE